MAPEVGFLWARVCFSAGTELPSSCRRLGSQHLEIRLDHLDSCLHVNVWVLGLKTCFSCAPHLRVSLLPAQCCHCSGSRAMLVPPGTCIRTEQEPLRAALLHPWIRDISLVLIVRSGDASTPWSLHVLSALHPVLSHPCNPPAPQDTANYYRTVGKREKKNGYFCIFLFFLFFCSSFAFLQVLMLAAILHKARPRACLVPCMHRGRMHAVVHSIEWVCVGGGAVSLVPCGLVPWL